jgi:hypothetical protein
LATDGDAVDISPEYFTPVYQKLRVAHTVMVIGSFRIVVGP